MAIANPKLTKWNNSKAGSSLDVIGVQTFFFSCTVIFILVQGLQHTQMVALDKRHHQALHADVKTIDDPCFPSMMTIWYRVFLGFSCNSWRAMPPEFWALSRWGLPVCARKTGRSCIWCSGSSQKRNRRWLCVDRRDDISIVGFV